MEKQNEYIFNATITKMRFYNSDSSWGVFEFKTEDNIPFLYDFSVDTFNLSGLSSNNIIEKRGIVSGKMQMLNEGSEYVIRGIPKNDKRFGQQYEPICISSTIPKTKEQSKIFLKTLVSDTLADSLLGEYPNVISDVVNDSNYNIDVSKVNGFGMTRWLEVKNKIIENYSLSDIIVLLSPLGVSFNMIKKLLDFEPNTAILKEKILNEPYILTKINGLGWKKIDSLALKLRPESQNSKERLCAFVKYYLTDVADGNGDTVIPISELKTAIANNVPTCKEHFEWALEQDNFLTVIDNYVGLSKYYNIEKYIFNELKRRNNICVYNDFSDCEIEGAIKEAEQEQGFCYTEQQKNAINKILHRNVSLLVGYAGVGKSSISRAIVKAFKRKGLIISGCALSAMAALRLKESANVSSTTIHRLLGWDGNGFVFNEHNKLNTDLLIIDEASMCNIQIIKSLISAIPDKAMILFVFDDGQLPPIGAGNIASNLLKYFDSDSKAILDKVMRQSNESAVLSDANKVRVGINPVVENQSGWISHGDNKDLVYGFFNDKEKIHSLAIKTYLNQISSSDINDTLFVCPKKEGLNSVQSFNEEIQNYLFDNGIQKIVCGNKEFKVGARVMCVKNDSSRGVYNGTMGKVVSVNDKGAEIEFYLPDDTTVVSKYSKNEMFSDIELGYCVTIHKSQGSGFKNVIIVMDMSSFIMLDKTILYTAITRAKKRAMILCQPEALGQCLKTNHAKRKTWCTVTSGNFE